jgi:hypothetical protein
LLTAVTTPDVETETALPWDTLQVTVFWRTSPSAFLTTAVNGSVTPSASKVSVVGDTTTDATVPPPGGLVPVGLLQAVARAVQAMTAVMLREIMAVP